MARGYGGDIGRGPSRGRGPSGGGIGQGPTRGVGAQRGGGGGPATNTKVCPTCRGSGRVSKVKASGSRNKPSSRGGAPKKMTKARVEGRR